MLPAEWRAGVVPAPLPEGVTVGDWVAFADAQTGKLDDAMAAPATRSASSNAVRRATPMR